MKTTIDLPDSLLAELRRVARSEGTTMRALIEQGLRRVLAERGERGAFRLRRVTFRGDGLVEDLAGASWDEVRRRAYEGRGE
ncbi:MAG: type II toxin-antitoxin system VapB family antitoxin [Gemmatimonadales bacterium]